jgi:hypothetical protein
MHGRKKGRTHLSAFLNSIELCLLSAAFLSRYSLNLGGNSLALLRTLSSLSSVGRQLSGSGILPPGAPPILSGQAGGAEAAMGWRGSGRQKEQVMVKIGTAFWVARTERVE